MSQLRAASSVKKRKDLYYSEPKKCYEHFINKKWVERNDIYQSKKDFIEISNSAWKKMTENDRTSFMKAPPPLRKNGIKTFFKKLPNKINSTPQIIESSENSTVNNNQTQVASLDLTINANTAVVNRNLFLNDKELKLVSTFLIEINVNPETFFTDDIKGDQKLIDCLKTFVYAWDIYDDLKQKYLGGKTLERKSELRSTLDNISKYILDLSYLFNETSSHRVVSNMTTFTLSQTYLKKSESIKNLLLELSTVKAKISENSLLNNLRRRIAQQNKTINKHFVRGTNELTETFCENDTRLTWEDVDSTFIDFQNSNTDLKTITVEELIYVSKLIRSNIVTEVSELQIDDTPDKIRKIVKFLPVMYLYSIHKSMFINLHEFVYTPGVFEAFIMPYENISDEIERNDVNEEVTCNDNENSKRRGIGGQPSIVSKFPGIVEATAEFVKQHGFAAQSRRRNDTGYSSGVTIEQIRKYLYKKFSDLEKHTVSKTTIRRMFEAPHQAHNTKDRYKGYIPARVGTKDNSYRKPHEDAHYLFARNKMRRELAALYSNDVSILSVDDMAKIKIGAPAVSRYHQIKRLYPNNDMPNLLDHDFPVPGYLINVSGHMFLKNEDFVIEQEKINNTSDETLTTLSNAEPNFNKMVIDAKSDNLFEVLAQQVNIHLNIKTTADECKDEIFLRITDLEKVEELKEILTKGTPIPMELVDIILNSASKLFNAKIVFFYNNEETVQFNIINQTSDTSEAPLYIFYSLCKTFHSMKFKKESLEYFRNVLNDYNGKITYDNIGRAHLPVPHSGPVHLSLRATKYHSSTIATHVNDLFKILKDSSKSSIMILADGGPDYSPASVANSLFYYRLFKKLNMDFLTVSTYAARYSAFNSIEHVWSPLSNRLSGVTFSPKLVNDNKPPCEQKGLNPNELRDKEFAVFNQAIDDLQQHWCNMTFDAHPVAINKIICGEEALEWEDLEVVKSFFKSPVRDLHKYREVKSECESMLKHIDRHRNELVFIRCKDRTCCTDWRSENVKQFLSKTNFMFPTTILGKSYEGHYDTFLERCIDTTQYYGEEGQPMAMAANLGKCDLCYSYHFKSKTEKARHITLFHRRQKTPNIDPNLPCNVCGKLFNSVASLNRHKLADKHTARDTRLANQNKRGSATSSQQPPRKKKQRNISTLLRQMTNDANSDSDIDEPEDKCEASNCIINNLENPIILTWVGCELCDKWFHSVCVGLEDLSKEELKNVNYTCDGH